MELFHNSQQTFYRNPAGALTPGGSVVLTLRASDCHAETAAVLCFYAEGPDQKQEIPMERRFSETGELLFSATVRLPDVPCLCWYSFQVYENGQRFDYGNNEAGLGGEGQTYENVYDPPAFQITVYRLEEVPSWYKQSVVYQIFPDRFSRDPLWMRRQEKAASACGEKGPGRIIMQNWNDRPWYAKDPRGNVTGWPFFGGSLEGIRSRLLYLKSLGVGTVYLNPIFCARSNHKYDTADYTRIDPAFGSERDFRRLAKDARRLGIRLVLDGVFNHTGADSIYFNQFNNYPGKGACQGEDSPYYSWYRFNRFPDDYECWWGVKNMPDLNEDNPDFRRYIYDEVISRWLKAGASGWRLDVADELPDSFIAGLRTVIKETAGDGLLIGEVWEDASNKISYGKRRTYFLGDELDGTMNYPFRDAFLEYILGHIPAERAVRQFNSLAENYPPENFAANLNLIGSHDRIRVLTLLGDPPEGLSEEEKEYYSLPDDKRDMAKRRLKALSLLQFILPGVPCIYYGDEAGVEGFSDPYNRGTYPWGKEDEELLAHYRMLAGLRNQYGLLKDGEFKLEAQGEHVIVCRRFKDSEEMALIVNRHLFGDVEATLNLPPDCEVVLDLIAAEEIFVGEKEEMHITMPPLSYRLLYICKNEFKRPALQRSAGVLCHVSSLPNGDMDEHGEKFIDFLSDAGQSLWQILPLNPVDEKGNSPYSSSAVFAGEPSLIPKGRGKGRSFIKYEDFCKQEAFWLEDYALYRVLKEHFDGLPWQEWPKRERNRRNLTAWRKKAGKEIERIKREQYDFWQRWQELHAYANEKGISVIGDLPLYPGVDSADTWAHPECFLLDEDGVPLAGAGVPPDYFNEEGQHWGNPLYDWDSMKKTGYAWWRERLAHSMRYYDYIRIDHFRAFSAYYAVPHGKTPKEGFWMPGPGKEFFESMTNKLGTLPLLAEDLGLLDAQVYSLLIQTGFPGMQVYQFTAREMEKMPPEKAAQRLFYTGTHDNQTLAGWCKDEQDPDEIIQKLYMSPGAWVITPLQDMLGLGDDCRMNIPGKPEGNWRWRFSEKQLTPGLATRFERLASGSDRKHF